MYACVHVPGLTPAQRPALIGCVASLSPLCEPGPDRVILDLRGMGTLLGKPREVAVRISTALAAAGFAGNIAIAANAHAATAAARGIEGITIIPPGDEARALARLPLSLLEPEEELGETLASWGIHTFGDLSKLPGDGLAERLGPEGVRLYILARGYCPAPIVPAQDPRLFESSMELEYPLDSLESLAFLLGRLLHEVCGGLVRQGLAAAGLALTFHLEDKSVWSRSLRLPFATVETATLLKLLQYDVAAHPPQSAIVRVKLKAEPSPQRRLQSGLFQPTAPEAEKLELTLARLAAVVGENNVGSPELINTYRPDAFRMNRFVARATDRQETTAAVPQPTLAIRLFRPPVRAKVVAPYGAPQRVTAPGFTGNVIAYAGPWRSSGEWWTPGAWTRDEWDVALHNGTICRLHHQPPDDWFVDGNYD